MYECWCRLMWLNVGLQNGGCDGNSSYRHCFGSARERGLLLSLLLHIIVYLYIWISPISRTLMSERLRLSACTGDYIGGYVYAKQQQQIHTTLFFFSHFISKRQRNSVNSKRGWLELNELLQCTIINVLGVIWANKHAIWIYINFRTWAICCCCRCSTTGSSAPPFDECISNQLSQSVCGAFEFILLVYYAVVMANRGDRNGWVGWRGIGMGICTRLQPSSCCYSMTMFPPHKTHKYNLNSHKFGLWQNNTLLDLRIRNKKTLT